MIMEPCDVTRELGEGSESLDQAKKTITEIEMLQNSPFALTITWFSAILINKIDKRKYNILYKLSIKVAQLE